MSFIALEEDILLSLFRFQSKRDLLSVMSTCRILFRTGLSTLFQRDISIETPPAILSFHEFLVFTSPSSFRYLRSIKILLPTWSNVRTKHHEGIADILKRAPNLRALSISAQLLKDNDSALAVASMRNLRRLTFARVFNMDQPVEILTHLSSPLTHMHIDSEDRNETSNVQLISAITKFAHTLEDVHFSYRSFSVPIVDPTRCCDKVTRLTSSPCWRPSLTALVTMFPNTRTLVMDLGDLFSPIPEDDPDLVAYHNENIVFQQSEQAWSSLNLVRAEWHALYAMGLQCEVNSLDIASSYTIFFEDLINSSVLHPLRPRHLRLALTQGPDSSHSLPIAGLERLEGLDIFFDLQGSNIQYIEE